MAENVDESPGNDAVAVDTLMQNDRKSLAIINASVPWIDYAVEQALIAQKNVVESLNHAFEVAGSRIDRFLTTGSAHLDQSLYMLQDSFQGLSSEYFKYENAAFGKIKDGVLVASSHPLITTGAVLGAGVLSIKRSRQFLYYRTLRTFVSEETLLSRADAKVKELKQSVDLLKLEGEKLEKRALLAEEDLVRGRTKLKQAGKQIRSAITSAYKIERQASGLKDALKELPSIEAKRFQKQVTILANDVKKERNVLSAEVTKISNYGISV